MSSGSMQSNDEDGDQKFDAGQDNSHKLLDSKDERTAANTLAAAEEVEKRDVSKSNTIEDPLEPARSHGHEPSRGAQIDAELQADEQEYLKRKGKA